MTICTICNPLMIKIKKENKTEFQLYKALVNNLTHRNRKQLLEKWNGYDYYDKEYIKDYFGFSIYSNKYPSIDHKISIFQGFNDNLSVEFIGSIGNLCITKRIINCKKSKNSNLY